MEDTKLIKLWVEGSYSVYKDTRIHTGGMVPMGEGEIYSMMIDEAAYPPTNFTPAFWRGWHMPLNMGFCFTRCFVQYHGILEKSLGLCSVIGGSTSTFACPTFPDEAPNIPANLFALSAWAGLDVLSGTFWHYHLCFTDLLYPLVCFFPCAKGSKFLRGTYLQYR